MTSTYSSPPRLGRSRARLVILLLAALCVATGFGWYGWRRYTAPAPPEIAREGLDPELAEAIERARQKIRQDPYSAYRWGTLGQMLRESLLLDEAVACFAQAERLDPKDPQWPYRQGEALRMSDPSAALSPLGRAAALAGNTGNVARHLRLAEVLLALGRGDEAGAQLRQALAIDPDDPSVHYNLAVLALARADLPESLAQLKRCELSPFTRQKACIQLAAVCRRMNRTEEADNYARKADQLPPDESWPDSFPTGVLTVGRPARYRKVSALETQGHYRAAAEQLAELIRQRPEYRFYIDLGRNLGKMGDFVGAEQVLLSAIAMEPANFKAHYELSRLWWVRAQMDARNDKKRAKKDYQEAADRARRAIALRTDHAMAHVILAMSLRELGMRKEAIASLRTAIECSPDLVEAHLLLGETLLDAGQLAEARTSLERAARLAHPDDPRPRAALVRWKERK